MQYERKLIAILACLQNAIIVFYELHNFTSWDQGEFKALKEIFGEKDFDYIAFGTKTNAAIRLNL